MRNRFGLTLIAGTLLAAACGSGEEGAFTEAAGDDQPTVSLDVDISTTISLPTTVLFDEPTTTAPSSSTSTGETTTSPVSEATTTSSPPSSVAAVSCSTGPVAVPDIDTPHVQLDVDGNGTMETVYAAWFNPVWMMIVEFDGGEYASEAIVDAEDGDDVRVLGGARFIGDKTDDIAFTVGGGAYTTAVGFMRSSGCNLERINWESGLAASFLTGASISNYSGISCSAGVVEQYFFSISGEDDAGDPLYEGGFTPYNLEGTTFVEFPGDGTVLTQDELSDLDTFSCFGLTL